MSEIAKLSRQIWHAKSVTSEPVVPSWDVPDLRNLPPETKAEVEAKVRRPPGEYLDDAMRRGVLELPRAGKLPIVGDALSNDVIRSQMGGLSDSISKIPPGTLRPLRQESLPSLEEVNQLAHDRIAALPPEQVQNVLAAGVSRESTMFLRRMASEIADVKTPPAASDTLQLEEVFQSVQTPEGDIQVLGRTLINNEWYHFGTNSGTSPLQQASTWIAPSRLMASSNPAQHRDLHAGRVLNDAQSLFQGRWKPYIKGAGLGGRPHTVDIRHADKDGIKSVLATLDTITGTLKTIQSVTKGIQQGLEFLGMMGSLGDLGKYMSIFNQMKLPGSPGELITALITGKGINPNKPPAPPTADQTGSGKDGVLVTQGGAAAKAIGDGLLAKVEAETKKKETAASDSSSPASPRNSKPPNDEQHHQKPPSPVPAGETMDDDTHANNHKLEPGEHRKLTDGERELARKVFGDSINLDEVKVHRDTYIFFQPDNTTMAPNGEIYLPDANYHDDFSLEDKEWQRHFIHEMTHVWQSQNGQWVTIRGIYEREYEYNVDTSKQLTDYKIEQQADIVADHFVLSTSNPQNPKDQQRLTELEQIIGDAFKK